MSEAITRTAVDYGGDPFTVELPLMLVTPAPALIFAACPVLAALIETVMWKVPLGRKRACRMLLAIADVLAVLSKGIGVTPGKLVFGRGDLRVMLAACGRALYTVLGKP